MKGINSELELPIEDARMNKKHSLITKGEGNLKGGKIKFDINLQIGLSLNDIDLNRSLVIHYKLKDQDLMRPGNHPFSISYKMNYALSNSHYSVEFSGREKIQIDELFAPLVKLESPILKPLKRSKSIMTIERTPLLEQEEGTSEPRFLPPRTSLDSKKFDKNLSEIKTELLKINKKL